MQQFSPWIAGFPGLIWSIDIPHSRLKVFNRWSIPGLDVPRLLKDARYRKKAVRREDHALLMEFWDMLTARRPAAVTFRLTNGNGTYILQGWPGENDTLYYGFLKEAFLPAAHSADGRPGTCQMDIGGIGYPVFALDIPTRGLLIINDAARSLFAAASRDPNTLGLADIAPAGLPKSAGKPEQSLCQRRVGGHAYVPRTPSAARSAPRYASPPAAARGKGGSCAWRS
ncbi:MAG: hypothetical protein ACLSAH_06040 [Bilophila wadsworthia]